MAHDDKQQLKLKIGDLLAQFQPQGWPKSLVEAGFLGQCIREDQKLTIDINLPFVAGGLAEILDQTYCGQLKALCDVVHLDWKINHNVVTMKRSSDLSSIPKVRNIIAISSGKGGVGKSTTAVNLALALHLEGGRVGLLDADIYGPSIPLMLGTKQARPTSPDGQHIEPVMRFGIASNSIGYMVPDEQAAIWRGPMASKALSQLLNDTLWPELDYLVVDMPPGTGDIQITMAQQVPTTAAVVVTTPQDVALADARKGINMFRQVNIPVLGVVENMSYYICSQCGRHDTIFGQGGGSTLVGETGSVLLGELPLHIDVRRDGDAGTPTVATRNQSPLTQAYRDLAMRTAAELYFSGEVVPTQIAVQQLD